MIDQAIAASGESTLNLDTKAAVEAALGNFAEALIIQEGVIKQVIGLASADLIVESSEFEGRLAMYNEGKPFVQTVKQVNENRLSQNKDAHSEGKGSQGKGSQGKGSDGPTHK